MKALFDRIDAVQSAFAAWPRVAVGLTGAVAIIVILGIDAWLGAAPRTFFQTAVTDEPAHLLTMIVLLAALPALVPPQAIAGMLTGVVFIDLDHLPILVGSDLLMQQTNRPLSHSFLPVLTVAALALALPERGRAFAMGFAGGILVHYWRDLATSTAGVPLLWPWMATGFRLPYEAYLASLIACVAKATHKRARPGP